MRILQSDRPRPLTLLAVGANGFVAAASSVFGNNDGLELWDATTGARLQPVLHVPDNLTAVAFAGGTRLVFGAVGGIVFGDTHIRYPQTVPALALHPDGERVVVAANYPQSVLECWRVRSAGAHLLAWQQHADGLHRYEVPAVDPTGVRVAAAERFEGPDGRPRQEVSVRDAATGTATARVPLDPAAPVRQLAFTADGEKLLVRDDSRTVQVFAAATGARAGELVHRGRPFVTAVAVHPRGPVACARTDGTVTLWDAERREVLRTLDWKAGKLVSLAFAPDGALGAAGTEDGKVVVWDVDG